MYLPKSSRCVLRNSSWLSPIVQDRGFTVSGRLTRGRLPEDDPSKPPLRLNIPREGGTIEFSVPDRQWKPDKRKQVANWPLKEPTPLGRSDTAKEFLRAKSQPKYDELLNFDTENRSEVVRKSQSNSSFKESRNSSQKSENQKFLVKSKSSESVIPLRYSEETDKSETDSTFKKEKNNEGVTANNESVVRENNGPIMVALESQVQDESINKNSNILQGLSEVESNGDNKPDENIRALAEAIINEISSKTNTPVSAASGTPQAEEDEAFLVIINIMDKDPNDDVNESVEEPARMVAEASTPFPEALDKKLPNLEDDLNQQRHQAQLQPQVNASHGDFYDEHRQVRHLDICDEDLSKPRTKSETRTGKTHKSIGKTKSDHVMPSVQLEPNPVFRNDHLRSGKISNEFGDFSLENNHREFQDLIHARQSRKVIYRDVKNRPLGGDGNILMLKDNEIVRRDNIDKKLPGIIRYTPIAKKEKSFGSFTKKKMVGKKKSTNELNQFVGSLSKNPTQRILDTRTTRPIEFAPEREMRIRTKIVPENELEKKIEALGVVTAVKEEPKLVPIKILKPLSKQITLIDEIPEFLRYPEYKYSVQMPKSYVEPSKLNDPKSKTKSRTIRTYFTSCSNQSKLNSESSDGSPSIVILKKATKPDPQKKDNSMGVFASPNNEKSSNHALCEGSRLKCSMSTLDNSCDLLNNCKLPDLKESNDVYLQEENMTKIVPTMKMKNRENMSDMYGEMYARKYSQREAMRQQPLFRMKNIEITYISKARKPNVPEDKSRKIISKAVIPLVSELCDDRYEIDIADISTTTGCRPPYGMAYPPKITTGIDGGGSWKTRKVTFSAEELLAGDGEPFELNDSCLKNQEKDIGSIGDSLLNSKRDAIMNVMKAEQATPKLSDNIVNLANEGLAEDKGVSSLDSLSMMKKVKEIVDLDLKNAERIFVPQIDEITCSGSGDYVPQTQESHPGHEIPEQENQPEVLVDTAVPELPTDPTPVEIPAPPQREFDPNSLKSVIVFNEETEEFRLDEWELDQAKQFQKLEMKNTIRNERDNFYMDENLLKVVEIQENFYDGHPGYVDGPKSPEPMRLMSGFQAGDSVIVFDEESKKWKVDFSVVPEKEEKKEGEESPEKKIIPEKVDEGKKHAPTSFPLFSVGKSEEEASVLEKKRTKKAREEKLKKMRKDPGKEVDAQAIRKKNSEFYDDVFIEIKKPKAAKLEESNEVRSVTNYSPKGKGDADPSMLAKGRSPKKAVAAPDANMMSASQEALIAGGPKSKDVGQPMMMSTSTNAKISENMEPEIISDLPKKSPVNQHYVSKNILKMSKNLEMNVAPKLRTNKIETVKLRICPTMRPPSKVTEINLNKNCDESNKDSIKKEKTVDQAGGSDKPPKKPNQENGNKTFYKKFEKYKTPFSDPEYEEKPMKINSDLESNPNLKKLDSWTKTLVLQEITKPAENIDSWVKDETDKMATLLLKVLQEAADGNSKKRIAAKTLQKGNPYEAIRKKQENSAGLLKAKIVASKRKDPERKRIVLGKEAPTDQRKKIGAVKQLETKEFGFVKEEKTKKGKGRFPVIEDELQVEVITADTFLPKDCFVRKKAVTPMTFVVNTDSVDDIPGPDFLKKLSSFWKCLPDIGCQATVFSMLWTNQLVKFGSSMLMPSNFGKVRNDPFGKLFTKYGPVVKLQGPLSGDIVLINRPEDISSVFSQELTSPARSIFDSVEKCRHRVRQKNFPIGITDLCDGFDWDIVRKATIDVGQKGCLQYFGSLKNAGAQLVDRIRVMKNHQNQVPEEFMFEVKKWSLEGLCSVLFERSLGFLENRSSHMMWVSESERLMRHVNDATNFLCQCESNFQIWRFFDSPAMMGLNQAYQSLDLIISKYVYQADISLRKKRKALMKNKQVAEKNLTYLESVLLNDRMSLDEITSNLIDILLVGSNTTSIALVFLLYNLAQNSRVQRQLFKEVKDLLPSKTSQLNYHQLHSLKYLQACVKESLRLNIPIPMILRVLPQDVALSNYFVPSGTHVVMDTTTACMREQNYEEPERFKPERWLDQDCTHPFSSIPFCQGPRASFTRRLAEIQLWTCIAKIIRNYQVEYHFGEVKGNGKVVSYPDKPLKFSFIERDE